MQKPEQAAQRWTIERLEKRHDRGSFDCGVAALNDFLKTAARQNQRDNVGRTFVATLPTEVQVVGFYTLTVGSVARESLPVEAARKLPRYPVPVAHLGRLAVDLSMRGKRLGEALLLHALEQVLRISDVVGIYAIDAHAKDQPARDFYARYGFRPLLDDHLHLFLPTAILPKLFG
jgi:GNAT superfamily N-acetyltransferase